MPRVFSCPICSKAFARGRAGWDAHVGSLALHKDWHPDVPDPEERKRLFRAEFAEFFVDRSPATAEAGADGSSSAARPKGPSRQTSLDQFTAEVREFVEARNWRQFHSPRNLAAALVVEAGEILEHFQWLTNKQSRDLSPRKIDAVKDELADVLIYLLRLADELGVDLMEAALQKLEKNRAKYPAERVKGDARKYDEYQ